MQYYAAAAPPPQGWSPEGLGFGAYWSLATGSGWFDAYTTTTIGPTTLSLNSQMPAGTYWVYFRINYDHTSQETPTTNDVVHVLLTLNVQAC